VEIAAEMFRRLEEAGDPDNPDPKLRTQYTDKFPVERLEKIVKDSLTRAKLKVATDGVKQKFLQALGTLRRKSSENVRYTPIPSRFVHRSTKDRQTESVGAAELRRDKTIFVTDQTRASLVDEQVEFYDEVVEPGSGYKCILVSNRMDLRAPMTGVIADSENERKFINALLDSKNIGHYDAWLKSTATRFYEIDYAWKKGEHPKRGKFSPDFFIKAGNIILVVEVKGDEELKDPSEENKKKNEYAVAHFQRVNDHLKEEGSNIKYKFNFLTQKNFGQYFQLLREGKIKDYRSELDVKLSEEA
jgi:type III restriction enzyme